MKAARLSSFLAFALLPLIFDMRCADPLSEPKLACWLVAAGLAGLAPHKPWSLPERFLAAWFGWATLSAWLNGITPAWMDLLTIGAGLVWVRAGMPRRHLFMGLGFGLTVTYAWIQHLKLDPFDWSHPELSVTRGIAGLGNPNYLAMYLACLSPWAWDYLYQRGPLGWLAGFLSATALLLTATRGAILILICMLAIGMFYSLFKRRRLGRFWILSWLILAISWPVSTRLSAHQRFGMANQMVSLRKGADPSVVARQLLWSAAWRAGLEHPLLGVGFGHYGDAYLFDRPKGEPEAMVKLSRRPEDPHNEALKVLSETGWVGLLLWSGWIGLGLRARLRQPGPETAGLMVLLANGLSNCFVVALWPLLLVWTTPQQEQATARPAPPSGPLVLLLCLALAAPGWWMQRIFWWDDEWDAQAQPRPLSLDTQTLVFRRAGQLDYQAPALLFSVDQDWSKRVAVVRIRLPFEGLAARLRVQDGNGREQLTDQQDGLPIVGNPNYDPKTSLLTLVLQPKDRDFDPSHIHSLQLLLSSSGQATSAGTLWVDAQSLLCENRWALELATRRVSNLDSYAVLCPPWERIGLAIHQAAAWENLARLKDSDLAWQRMEAAARQRVALEPGNAFSWISLASVFSRQRRWSESLGYWQEAQRRDSGNPHTLFLLGIAQYNAGLRPEALNSLERSLEIYSKSSEVYRFRAQIMIDQGMVWEGYWDWVRSEQLREGE